MNDSYQPDPNKSVTQPLDKATNEKFDKVTRKIVRLLAMLTNKPDSAEFMQAARSLPQVLSTAGLDIYVLISRIEHGKGDEDLSASEMQKIHDAGYAKGYAEGAEQGRRSAVIAAAMPMGLIDDRNVGSGVNGFGWLEIAQHCAANKHRISRDKDREFIDSIFEQMTYRHKTPTTGQAKWLRDIFNQRFGGPID